MKISKKTWLVLRYVLLFLIIAGTAWFFYREFTANWEQLISARITYRPWLLIIAFILICAGYFVNTLAWQRLINHYAHGRKINFTESIAIVNTSQLTKYLPGKVWSVALQVWWMGEKGFSRPLVFFVNMVAILSSLLATICTGLILFIATSDLLNGNQAAMAIIAMLSFYALFSIFHGPIFNLVVKLINRLFKKDIATFHITRTSIILVQLLYLSANAVFAAGMYFVCLGLGFENNFGAILTILGAVLISDFIGFIVLISPGGLGVREGVMYLILEKVSVISLALVIPVATRIITMIADLVIGAAGMILLRRFRKKT